MKSLIFKLDSDALGVALDSIEVLMLEFTAGPSDFNFTGTFEELYSELDRLDKAERPKLEIAQLSRSGQMFITFSDQFIPLDDLSVL